MSDPITPETFSHLVHLAALELDPQESEYLRQQLNNQLKAIYVLEAIPLDDRVQITSHGIPYSPEMTSPIRQDVISPHPNPQDIISQAPEHEEGYIIVPDIHHTELE